MRSTLAKLFLESLTFFSVVSLRDSDRDSPGWGSICLCNPLYQFEQVDSQDGFIRGRLVANTSILGVREETKIRLI